MHRKAIKKFNNKQNRSGTMTLYDGDFENFSVNAKIKTKL